MSQRPLMSPLFDWLRIMAMPFAGGRCFLEHRSFIFSRRGKRCFGLRRKLNIISAGVDECAFLFFPSRGQTVDHRQAAPATSDCSQTRSLPVVAQHACVRAS